MRKLWDFHGISQLNKAELIQELTKRIADNLESWLQYLGSEQTEFLKEIIMQCEKYSAAYIEVNEFTFYIADYFKARGVVFLGQHQESAIFLIPGELRIKIKSILNRKSIKKQIRLNDSYIKYAVGSAVYYGILSPELLYNSLERYLTPEWRIDPLDVVLEYGEFSVLADSAGPFFILGAVEDAAEDFEIDIFAGKDELIKLINDFHNNTKQWVLKGHSPAEVYNK